MYVLLDTRGTSYPPCCGVTHSPSEVTFPSEATGKAIRLYPTMAWAESTSLEFRVSQAPTLGLDTALPLPQTHPFTSYRRKTA